MILGENFAFVRNPKTASTSVFQALKRDYMTRNYYPQHKTLWGEPFEIYNLPYRITTVRNPFDRMASCYQVWHKERTFEEFLRYGEVFEAFDITRTPQITWAWKCNRILKFENFDEDWERLRQEMGWEVEIEKFNVTEDKKPYRSYYSDKTRRIVEDRFRPDLVKWGYTF